MKWNVKYQEKGHIIPGNVIIHGHCEICVKWSFRALYSEQEFNIITITQC